MVWIAVLFVAFGLVAQRLERSSVTGPITSEKLFLGWFGPRGLASILLLLLARRMGGAVTVRASPG